MYFSPGQDGPISFNRFSYLRPCCFQDYESGITFGNSMNAYSNTVKDAIT